VVERALRRAGFHEQILDAEPLVAARLDQALAGFDEPVAPGGVLVPVDRPWCRLPLISGGLRA